jgi:hypothetical protein
MTIINCLVAIIFCLVAVIPCLITVIRSLITVIPCLVTAILCLISVIPCLVTVILCLIVIVLCLVKEYVREERLPGGVPTPFVRPNDLPISQKLGQDPEGNIPRSRNFLLEGRSRTIAWPIFFNLYILWDRQSRAFYPSLSLWAGRRCVM